MKSDNSYYCIDPNSTGTPQGPYTRHEIKTMRSKGEIGDKHLVAKEGWTDWRTLESEFGRHGSRSKKRMVIAISITLVILASGALTWRIISNQGHSSVIVKKSSRRFNGEAIAILNTIDIKVHLKELLSNPNMTDDLRVRFLTSEDPEVRAAIAHACKSYDALSNLSNDASMNVREAVAGNTSSPANVLVKLANDAEVDVRRAVAGNEKSPQDALMTLAADADNLIQLRLSSNKSATPPVLLKMAKNGPYSIALTLGNENLPAKYLKAALESNELGFRRMAASNPNAPREIMKRMADDPFVLPSVAENPSVSVQFLEWCAGNLDSEVRRGVAQNKKCPPDILKALSKDSDTNVIKAVADNENTPGGALSQLARSSNPDVRMRVAEHANTLVSALRELANDSDENIRWRVAKSSNATADLLEMMVADSSVRVRAYIAQNPNTPDDLIKKLANDASENVRGAILGNIAIPEETLRILAESTLPKGNKAAGDMRAPLSSEHQDNSVNNSQNLPSEQPSQSRLAEGVQKTSKRKSLFDGLTSKNISERTRILLFNAVNQNRDLSDKFIPVEDAKLLLNRMVESRAKKNGDIYNPSILSSSAAAGDYVDSLVRYNLMLKIAKINKKPLDTKFEDVAAAEMKKHGVPLLTQSEVAQRKAWRDSILPLASHYGNASRYFFEHIGTVGFKEPVTWTIEERTIYTMKIQAALSRIGYGRGVALFHAIYGDEKYKNLSSAEKTKLDAIIRNGELSESDVEFVEKIAEKTIGSTLKTNEDVASLIDKIPRSRQRAIGLSLMNNLETTLDKISFNRWLAQAEFINPRVERPLEILSKINGSPGVIKAAEAFKFKEGDAEFVNSEEIGSDARDAIAKRMENSTPAQRLSIATLIQLAAGSSKEYTGYVRSSEDAYRQLNNRTIIHSYDPSLNDPTNYPAIATSAYRLEDAFSSSEIDNFVKIIKPIIYREVDYNLKPEAIHKTTPDSEGAANGSTTNSTESLISGSPKEKSKVEEICDQINQLIPSDQLSQKYGLQSAQALLAADFKVKNMKISASRLETEGRRLANMQDDRSKRFRLNEPDEIVFIDNSSRREKGEQMLKQAEEILADANSIAALKADFTAKVVAQVEPLLPDSRKWVASVSGKTHETDAKFIATEGTDSVLLLTKARQLICVSKKILSRDDLAYLEGQGACSLPVKASTTTAKEPVQNSPFGKSPTRPSELAGEESAKSGVSQNPFGTMR